MKLKNFFLFLIVALTAATLPSSCLNDDDNSTSTVSSSEFLNNLTGGYTGKVSGTYGGKTLGETTIAWTMDSAGAHIANIPVSWLAAGLTSNTTLKAVIDTMSTATMQVGIAQTGASSTQYTFLTFPSMAFTVNYGGADHTYYVDYNTTVLAGYTTGYYLLSSYQMQMTLAITGLKERVHGELTDVSGWEGYVQYSMLSTQKYN